MEIGKLTERSSEDSRSELHEWVDDPERMLFCNSLTIEDGEISLALLYSGGARYSKLEGIDREVVGNILDILRSAAMIAGDPELAPRLLRMLRAILKDRMVIDPAVMPEEKANTLRSELTTIPVDFIVDAGRITNSPPKPD